MIDKGTYVRIRKTILKPGERTANIPDETKKVPFKMWIKGYLMQDSDLFDMVEIKTITGRTEVGRLKEANPPYKHNYGDFVQELNDLKHIILSDFRGDNNE